jgi:hypothetical protein
MSQDFESIQGNKAKEGRQQKSLEFLANYPIAIQKLANEYFLADASNTVEGIAKMETAKEAMIKLASRKVSTEAGLKRKMITHGEIEERAVKVVDDYLEREAKKIARRKAMGSPAARQAAKRAQQAHEKSKVGGFTSFAGWMTVVGLGLAVLMLFVERVAGGAESDDFKLLGNVMMVSCLILGMAGALCWGVGRFISALAKQAQRR